MPARAKAILKKRVLDNPFIPKRPHPVTGQIGPTPKQAAFLLAPHREALYGGAAGGGKSDALLMGALMYADTPGYAALILRRSYADLALPGAIMDRANEWLRPTDARWDERDKTWTFPSGATLSFGYLQTRDDHFRYSSAEFQYIAFDEVTQFAERQYRFMNSRTRRLEGSKVPIRMRSATNPVGTGKVWVKRYFLDDGPGAIDEITGLPAPRLFIPARLDDNPFLDRTDYLRSLANLDPVTREQLLNGNWDARAPGAMFRREWFPILDVAPVSMRATVRYWDLAATEEAPDTDPDWTVGGKMGWGEDGRFYFSEVIRKRVTPFHVEQLIRNTAAADGHDVQVGIEQEPGASGKLSIDHFRRTVLPGYYVEPGGTSGSKIERARPVSGQSEAKNVVLIRGPWLTDFFDEVEAFPEVDHDDQVDVLSGAYNHLTQSSGIVERGPGLWG